MTTCLHHVQLICAGMPKPLLPVGVISVSKKLGCVPAYLARDGSLYGFVVLDIECSSGEEGSRMALCNNNGKKLGSLYECIKGRAYRLCVNYDGNKVGDIIIFSHLSSDKKGKLVGVFSPNGEPDMQSMFMAYLEEIEHV